MLNWHRLLPCGDLCGGQDVGIEASTFFKSMHMEVITTFNYGCGDDSNVLFTGEVVAVAVYCPVNVVLTAVSYSVDVAVTAVFNSQKWR